MNKSKENVKRLVIVESPTKARTIRGFLPPGYQVVASMGHVRDLPESARQIPAEVKKQPWARLGVNVEAGFEPLYVVPSGKAKVIRELKKELRGADQLIIATDEDREGESIGWHLVEVLEPKVDVSRMVFHEITAEAIQAALGSPRQIDQDLVRAQETRRILDRLVGYTVSPLLWKKISSGLSAGRVQSVAVRLIVERERERRAFRSGSYWDLHAFLAAGGQRFEADLAFLDGVPLATGRDFDEATGRVAERRQVVLLSEAEARALSEKVAKGRWTVAEIDHRTVERKPAPPFITSTLQQEGNRKLGLPARDTMRVAQRLYERGLITYMRTDSVNLSGEAIGAARETVRRRYGDDYLSPQPRQYTSKTKGAQEAHEAIRPAGTAMKTADELGLTGVDAALYDLIWKRTVATQMANARQTHTTVFIDVEGARFRARGKRIDFPGFFRAYVEGSDDPDAALDDRDNPLPRLAQGDDVDLSELEPRGHETKPPARFTEATLVRTLENEGIGRPSTYASIISTILDRGYVRRAGGQLVPTFTAFAVTGLLEEHFSNLVDTSFTARMEEELDEIAEGKTEWLPYLERFFLGEDGLQDRVKEGEEKIDARQASTVRLEDIPGEIRIGRFGPFVEVRQDGADTATASIPEDVAPADLEGEEVLRLVREQSAGPKTLGSHPESGEPVYLKQGPYGPYVQLGDPDPEDKKKKPKRTSLPKGMTPDDVTFDIALGLLSLPRALGDHPETGEPVRAGIGRFGPFVVHGNDFRSLEKGDDVLTVDLDRALELLAKPKGRGRGALREIGAHPADGKPITLHKGRYGPYVKHGRTNASLPKDVSADDVTLEQAVALIEEREKGAKGKKAAPARKKKAAKKKPAAKKKKTAPKSKAAKSRKSPS